MTKPSLLFVNQHYWPDVASTGQHLTDLAEYLAADGFDVSVLCGRGRYLGGRLKVPKRQVRNGVRIWRMATIGLGRGSLLGRTVDYLSFYVKAFLWLARGSRYNCVITLTTPSILCFVGCCVRRIRGQPYGVWSMDLHPEIEETLGIFRRGRLFTRFLRFCAVAGDRNADFVVDLGPYMKAQLRRRGVPGGRLHTIPVWSRREEIFPVPKCQNPLAVQLDLQDEFVVMYSGNAGLAHRFDEVLEAMRALNGHPDLEFLFVGGGPRKPEILDYVEKERISNFRYLEYFPRERLAQALSLGDVHLLTLRQDMAGLAVPGKLYGILAAGRPVVMVGPRRSEPAEVVETHGVGIVLDPADVGGDAESAGWRLAEVLEELRTNPGNRARMAARARSVFLEHYECRISCEAWRHLLSAQLARHGRGDHIPCGGTDRG